MRKLKLLIISITVLFLTNSSCTKKIHTENYLRTVLNNLEKIESATYSLQKESWQLGDTTAMFVNRSFIKEIRNLGDSTIGASFVSLDFDDSNKLNFGYDGNVRVLVYDDKKEIVIDDFSFRPLPFRPVTPPFLNYTESIIRYTLQTTDSITVDLHDLGDHYHLRLVIHEEKQVEFFGDAHHMPENPYNLGETTSLYELWIDKSNDLPYKVRREMSHDISMATISDMKPNNLEKSDFDVFSFLPDDYEVRAYGDRKESILKNPLKGNKAPDWSLKDINGKTIALTDLKSKIILINFTGIGCGPCQASIPFLNNLSNHFSTEDLSLVAIESWVQNKQSHKNYVARNNISYMFLNSNDEVLESYQTGRAAPVFFVLDEQRIIREIFNGYSVEITGNEILKTLNEMFQ